MEANGRLLFDLASFESFKKLPYIIKNRGTLGEGV